MGVNILKITEAKSRTGKDKEQVVTVCENYREAIEMVEKLNSKNTNSRVKYKTGFIITR